MHLCVHTIVCYKSRTTNVDHVVLALSPSMNVEQEERLSKTETVQGGLFQICTMKIYDQMRHFIFYWYLTLMVRH